MAKAKKKMPTKKPAIKSAAKKSPAKKVAKKTASKTKPNSGFMKALTPSEQLAKVVGPAALARTEVTKRLWIYIKEHKLQDPKNMRNIIADDVMKPIFGGKSMISMFEMTKLVSKHLK